MRVHQEPLQPGGGIGFSRNGGKARHVGLGVGLVGRDQVAFGTPAFGDDLATCRDATLGRIGADGLTIAFNVYEVAPYAMGPQDITLPWAALRDELTNLGQSIVTAAR